MTTTTETDHQKKIEIALSDRAPVRIVAAEWPVIARAEDHDGAVECQANRVYRVCVRRRRYSEVAAGSKSLDVLVYATLTAGGGGMPAGEREVRAGFLLTTQRGVAVPTDEIVRAIRRAAGVIGRPDLAAECIADLPAEDL